jgi:hypothetical protein
VSVAPVGVVDCITVFAWFTAPVVLVAPVSAPSYTLTPLATELSVALTTLTPFAPSRAVPESDVIELLEVVTDDPVVAMLPPADCVAPAVTLSICVSLMACAFLVLVDG